MGEIIASAARSELNRSIRFISAQNVSDRMESKRDENLRFFRRFHHRGLGHDGTRVGQRLHQRCHYRRRCRSLCGSSRYTRRRGRLYYRAAPRPQTRTSVSTRSRRRWFIAVRRPNYTIPRPWRALHHVALEIRQDPSGFKFRRAQPPLIDLLVPTIRTKSAGDWETGRAPLLA